MGRGMRAGLPKYPVIAAALRTTTERLTREIAEPRDQPPDWNEFEWTVARAVSAMHGISSLLATGLRWHGPRDWDAFLQEQRQQTLACYDRIGHVLARLDGAARRTGLACIALKGSALRQFAIHHPGERPMGDIDLLVRPSDTSLATEVISSIGYRHVATARRHIKFAPVDAPSAHSYAEHLDNPLRIELHQFIREALPWSPVDVTEDLWPATVKAGVNPYASFVALMRHVMLHTSGNMRANAMRFLQIYDIALMARRMSASDWAELVGGNPRVTAWWMYPTLAMADRYVGGCVPSDVLTKLAAYCPRKLRERFDTCTVSEVSWSNLRIAALPGIEWARSMSEKIRFARSRAFPSQQALIELREGFGGDKGATRWYRGSQIERVIRWTFGRPPRVQTINSVRAASGATTGYRSTT
jgi:hypothetical protein